MASGEDDQREMWERRPYAFHWTPEREDQAVSEPEQEREIKAYRITDRAADLIDAAITKLGVTDDVGWDLIIVPQNEQGPGVAIFWSEPGAVLGTVVASFGFTPLPFTEDKAEGAVRGCREAAQQARSQQLQQAQAGFDGQNGHHPQGPSGLLGP